MNNTTEKAPEVIIRKFPFKLDDDEKLDRGEKLAAEVQSVYDARESAKNAAAENKKIVESHESTVRELREVVATGTEWREVECQERKYLATGEAILVRMDTGDEIETRPLSQRERRELSQTEMNFKEGNK